jgi:hypothetical protein
MATAGGPNIETNGLVLKLDAANVKSFRGEPTINIVSSPQFTSFTNVTVGDASIIKTNFGGGRIGIQMTQVVTSNIVSFTIPLTTSTLVSGGIYTLSSEIESTKTGGLVKSQVTVQVNGVTHWLTNLNTWVTTVTESSHLFTSSQIGTNHRVATTFTLPVGTLTNFSLGGFYRTTSDFVLKIANVQFEAKAYATPFVIGTRGTTAATGGGWEDTSGNNNHGELVNGPIYSSANGGSIVFDGVDDFSTIPDHPSLNFGSGAFTLECFFRPKSTQSGGNFPAILNKSTGDFTDSPLLGAIGWIIYWDTNVNLYRFRLRDGTSSNDINFPGTINNNNTWRCLSVSIPTSGRSIVGYHNGNSIGSVTRTVGSTNINVALTIAMWRQFARELNTDVGAVRIYNRALSATEIFQNYNAAKSRFGL